MRSITNCPACQTQFVVTEEQLNQHNGKVRCGHCLQVFNAKEQLVALNTPPATEPTSIDEAAAEADWPALDDDVLNDPQVPIADEVESVATSADDVATEIVEIIDYSTAYSNTAYDSTAYDNAGETVNGASVSSAQPSYFDDAVGKTKLYRHGAAKKSRTWLWFLLSLLLLLIAIAQTTYFLRNEIAIYYPNAKPYLVLACKQIACSIDLPKKIELIVIDDSDIEEDANYAGLIRLSSTLINQAGFSQAYPNVELTLTDVEDKPKLRRIFKPVDYLPEHTDIAKGLAPGEEVKIKLAMTTQGTMLAGYRVFVTY